MTHPATRQVELRILSECSPEVKHTLQIDRNYGTPYAFWSSAVTRGLATKDEMQAASLTYGSLWHYRGD